MSKYLEAYDESRQMNTKEGWLKQNRFVAFKSKSVGMINGEDYYVKMQTAILDEYLEDITEHISECFSRMGHRNFSSETAFDAVDYTSINSAKDDMISIVNDLGDLIKYFMDNKN